MPNPLAGKRAFVTAATQGIGWASALALAAAGAEVVATGRNAISKRASPVDRAGSLGRLTSCRPP